LENWRGGRHLNGAGPGPLQCEINDGLLLNVELNTFAAFP
jgi:hypothetical protein